MLSPSEQKPWQSHWGNDLPPIEECECTVYEFLRKRNAGSDDLPALRYFDNQFSFGDLFKNIHQTANAFRRLGVKQGDIVTVCSVMTPETIYCFYALDMLGATLNMADPRTSSHGLHGYIEEVHSKVVVCLNVAYDKIRRAVAGTGVEKVISVSPADSLPTGKKIAFKLFKEKKIKYESNVVLWKDFFDSAAADAEPTPVAYDPNHAIAIMHTGGTTGRPKGVMLGDKAFNAFAIQFGIKRLTRGERLLNIMPPFIAYGYGCGTHAPLTHGVEIIIIPQFDPNDFGKLILKYKPHHTAGVPLHYQTLITDPKVKNIDLSFMISTGSGGDGITVAAEDAVNEFLMAHKSPYLLNKGYGMTEACAAITAGIRDVNRRGSVGIPLCYTTVGIFELDSDKELDYNAEGEICCMTPTVMLGYYEMPDEDKLVLRKHSDGNVWIHTGDIGRMDEDGYVYVINRIKRVIIRHDGFKVFPYAIEDVVTRVPGVKLACAVPIKDKDHKQGNLPYVFAVAEDGADPVELEQNVRKACDLELAEYLIPVGYKFVEKMPYTPIGKIDYLSLQKSTEEIQY